MKSPLLLAIVDGFGIREEKKGNAVEIANMPNYDFLLNNFPNSTLKASGAAVGLPDGQMGNSEVGHQNIGAGRVVFQQLQMINNKIETGSFFENEVLTAAMKKVKETGHKLHIIGLASDAGVHSKFNHLFALIDLCKKEGLENFYIHALTDGRDTMPNSSLGFLNQINDKLTDTEIGKIASIGGRYYGMDRDNRYDRIEKCYDVLTGMTDKYYENYQEAIKENYEQGQTDEFIIPGLIDKDGTIEDGDQIIFFNYRPDRLRELGAALSNKDFIGFKRKKEVNITLSTMMPISNEAIYTSAFSLQVLDNTFGEYISNQGLTQLRIAETEKYAHVTYFFDGGEEKDLKGAERILVPSPKVATYDLQPEMSAKIITEKLLEKLPEVDVVILNFANGDMLGHTGNIEAAVNGLEIVDDCLGKIYQKITELNGLMIVTADHGNCELMLDENDEVITSHTTSLVPFIVCNKDYKLKDGKLGDIAPTMLKLLDLEIPKEMTGEVLIQE